MWVRGLAYALTMPESMITLSARDARRLAVRAQLLSAPRPDDILTVARQLCSIQMDLTRYVAPSPLLVLWSRLGRRFDPSQLAEALDDRDLVEYRGYLRPAEDIRLFRPEMKAWEREAHPQNVRWVADNDHAREEILQVLRSDGPLAAREIEAPFRRHWRSSGWNNAKSVPMMLERMEERGEVAVSHRVGRERVWDIASRIFPVDDPVPADEARRILAERRLAHLGIARERGPAWQSVGELGTSARVEGIRGTWRVHLPYLDEPFRGRTALLSPLDRLIFDRRRMVELFAFDYALEMYKPADSRKWGYFALPVLHGDKLIGKVDAESHDETGELTLHALHQDEPWSSTARELVESELRSLQTLIQRLPD